MRGWLPAVLLLLAFAMPARAHLASDSYLHLTVTSNGTVAGQWDIALRDLDVAVGLDADQDGAITWSELRAKQKEVEDYAFSRLALSRGLEACRVMPNKLLVDYHAGSGYAVMPFSVDCTANGELTLRYRLLFDIDPSHRGLLSVDSFEAVQTDILTPDHSEVTIAGSDTLTDRAIRFFQFGFDHILLGYDHLLFIAVLLLTAGLQRNAAGRWVPAGDIGAVMVDALKLLTAFTIAHAAVLTPAMLGVINVPARFVEPAIAATIVLAALDNARPMLPRLRWQVAFMFGLVHGLSFASTLGPMRLASGDFAVALACFNLGVEGGQVALALLLVPIVFALREASAYRRFALPAFSIAAAALAGLWGLDQAIGLDLMSLVPVAMAR